MEIGFRATAIGRIGIATGDGVVTALFFGDPPNIQRYHQSAPTILLDEAFRQLEAWLAGQIRDFTLPLAAEGSEFALRVRRAVQAIPYGQTRSYNQVAAAIGSLRASRAVGSACARNPLPIVIPCHRVICGDGTPGGYLGGTLIKRRLLELERRNLA